MSFLKKRLMEPEKVTVLLDKVAEGLGLKIFPSSYPQFIVGISVLIELLFRQENVTKCANTFNLPHLHHKRLSN